MKVDRGISHVRSVAYLLAVWGSIIGALAIYALWPGWLSLAVAFVVVSTRQNALLMVEHECWHFSLFRHRRLNNVVGTVMAGWPVGSSFLAGRSRHLAHHRLLGSHADPDFDYHRTEGKQTGGRAVKYFLGLLLGRQLGYALFLRREDHGSSRDATPQRGGSVRRLWPDALGIAGTQAVLLALFWVALDWWVYPVLWLLPLMTLTTFANGVRAFVEHYSFEGDEVAADDRLFTIEAPWYERAFFSPMNFNFHAEHHLQPAVSAFRLPALRDVYLSQDRIVLRRGYLRTLLRVLRPGLQPNADRNRMSDAADDNAPNDAHLGAARTPSSRHSRLGSTRATTTIPCPHQVKPKANA